MLTEQDRYPDILCVLGLRACFFPVLFPLMLERSISCHSLGLTSAVSLCRSGAKQEVSCRALKSCSAPGANWQRSALVPRY